MTQSKFAASAVAFAFTLALAGVAAAPASAAGLNTFTETSEDFTVDNNFNALCGGTDNFGCEYTVAQGVAGNRKSNGNTEATIFNRLTNNATGAQTAGWSETSSFSLGFDADGGAGGLGRVTLDAVGMGAPISGDYDFGAAPGGNNPAGPATSIVIRASRASLTNMMLNGMALPDLDALPASRAYLYVGGFDVTADWLLTGTLMTNPAFKNSATGFQVKVTDLDVPAIPVPAALPLLGGALAALGLIRRRANKAA